MYVLNELGKKKINLYTIKQVAIETGISQPRVSKIKKGVPCNKVYAYCITKLINADKEINDYFNLEIGEVENLESE